MTIASIVNEAEFRKYYAKLYNITKGCMTTQLGLESTLDSPTYQF